MVDLTAKLQSDNPIKWSDDSLFDGFVLLIMSFPDSGGTAWTNARLRDTENLRVPARIKVPIRLGLYDANTRIWRTDALVPPRVKYSAFFYDSTGRLVANGASLFAVAVESYTLNPPTLTAPTAPAVPPTP